MVIKARLEFRLLSTMRIAGDHFLTLNLKNVGSSILKNLVVQLHSPDPRFSVDCARRFVYALMPNAYENVKFWVFASSLARKERTSFGVFRKRAYFSVSGYASGDAYFSIESPVMDVQTKDLMKNRMLM